jgi:hypothetical protein
MTATVVRAIIGWKPRSGGQVVQHTPGPLLREPERSMNIVHPGSTPLEPPTLPSLDLPAQQNGGSDSRAEHPIEIPRTEG